MLNLHPQAPRRRHPHAAGPDRLSFVLMNAAPGNPFTGESELPPAGPGQHQCELRPRPAGWQQIARLRLEHRRPFRFRPVLRLQGPHGQRHHRPGLSGHPDLRAAGLSSSPSSVGVALGIAAAIRHNSALDYVAVGSSIGAQVLPNFVLAPILVLVFTLWLGWLPGGGWQGPWNNVILPVIALSTSLHGVHRADHALLDARSAELQLHPHRQGQGPARRRGSCAMR